MSSNLALQISDLHKVYSDGTVALKGINFNVEQGDFFALLGPNGAGKTTTIDIITSIANKTSGKVIINGIDIDDNFSLAKSKLGVVPQEPNFNFFETPLQIVTKQAGFYGITAKQSKDRAKYLLGKLGLWHKKDIQARSLSGGMKRRLMIARGLIHNPKLLILDEPTAGVDVELRREMLTFIKEINDLGTTIILTTHYLEEAEMLCKNIAILDQGEMIINSTIKQLIKILDTETFILNLDCNLPITPEIPDFPANRIDENTLEIEVKKNQNLNTLFSALSKQKIKVLSLKNKVNRLEEYFIKLTSKV